MRVFGAAMPATGLNGPTSPFVLRYKPVAAPLSSRTATHNRAGRPPPAAVHTTSVQISASPPAALNGAAATFVHVAAGAPVRVHKPPDVAATNVVASAGSTARR
jgi:hypothetical protein